METMQSELKLAHDQMGTMWEELGRQQVTNPLVSIVICVINSTIGEGLSVAPD